MASHIAKGTILAARPIHGELIWFFYKVLSVKNNFATVLPIRGEIVELDELTDHSGIFAWLSYTVPWMPDTPQRNAKPYRHRIRKSSRWGDWIKVMGHDDWTAIAVEWTGWPLMCAELDDGKVLARGGIPI